MDYALPELARPPRVQKNQVLLVASGDLRPAANRNCWASQQEMEEKLRHAISALGYELVRAHPYRPEEGHGFISSQKEGMAVFAGIDPKAPLIVAEAVWQYSHHVLHGLVSHRGPILTVANWSGTWPGLVGMLNLNGSLTKADVKYSTLWSEDFTGRILHDRIGAAGCARECCDTRPITSSIGMISSPPKAERKLGKTLAEQLLRDKAIMGVFDEGCMGMFNAIIPDDLLHATGVYKERLSQSALYYETTQVRDEEATAVRQWMEQPRHEIRHRLKRRRRIDRRTDSPAMQNVHRRPAHCRRFGCHTIGIQYQQGLKDLLPASDLVEGTLNNADRPPATSRDGLRVLYAGETAAAFQRSRRVVRGSMRLMTHRVHSAMGQPVENTLHDIRWGDVDRSGTVDDYVWVFLISGAAPPAHFPGGWAGRVERATAEDVFPARRWNAEGQFAARRNRLVARLRRARTIEDGPGTSSCRRAAGRRNTAPLAGDHAAMADHARRDVRSIARPDDGAA